MRTSIKERTAYCTFDELRKFTRVILDKIKLLYLIITWRRKRVEAENLILKPGKVLENNTTPSPRFLKANFKCYHMHQKWGPKFEQSKKISAPAGPEVN